jgi:YegS/Rv2252/BmrU family lipid kinase
VRAWIIINPVSGRRHRGDVGTLRTRAAIDAFRGCQVDPRVHVTTGPGDARVAAAGAVEGGAELVVAWGGDGTINEVASALAGTGVPLGIVPAGSGNGLARELGLPWKPADAILHAVVASARSIDVGDIDGRVFVNVAGLGLDALIARRFNALRRRRHGIVTYVRATIAELKAFEPLRCAIEADGERLEASAAIVAFANLAQYGNRARIAPGASPDDGLLDLVIVESDRLLAILWRARRLFDGSLLRDGRVRHRRVREARVETGVPTWCHADGEPAPAALVTRVRVRPGALLVKA